MEAAVGALLAETGVAEHSIVLVGRPAKPPDLDVLVRRAWDLPAVARSYEAFIAGATPLRGTPASDLEAFKGRTLMIHLFRAFPFEDPELPDDPAGLGALRAEAVGLFDELFRALEAPAQRHFDAVTGSPSARSVAGGGS
jgi:phenylacetic acid degradation operon negative regulatory protein